MTVDLTLHIGNGDNAVEVGLSKPLSQLAISDFTDNIVNVGAIDDRIELSSIWGFTSGSNVPIAGDGVSMYSYEKNDYTGWYLDGNQGYSCGYNNEFKNGMYIRSVLAYIPDINYQGTVNDNFTVNNATARLVTDMDIQNVYLLCNMHGDNNITLTDDTNKDTKVFSRYHSLRNKHDNLGITDEGYTLGVIAPIWLIVRGDNVILWSGALSMYYDNYGNRGAYGNGTTQDTKAFDGIVSFSAQPLMYDDEDTLVYETTNEYTYRNEKENYSVTWKSGGWSGYYWTKTPKQTYEMLVNQTSWAGLYFKITTNGKLYKPVIQGGIVTGYTDDLSTPSEIDTWNNIHDHGIPVNPPTDSDSDNTEKMNIGGMYTAGGMVNYYAISDSDTLDRLSEHLSSWDYVATGKDVLKNLVSLKAFPISRDRLCHGFSKEIIIAGTHTEVNALSVDSTFEKISLGNINITPEFNDFRDYAPYTKLEVNCPFVGWIEIPSHCMNHNITIEMTYDIITGSCRVFVILDNNTIVAEKSGVICFDIPFTADAVGAKASGLISGVLGVATSTLGGVTSLATANPIGIGSSIIGLANSVSQLVNTKNANYTQAVGNTGDANNFSGVKKCYLKITRPISHEPIDYKRTVGYMYNNTHTLDRNMGYTTVKNPYIKGTMLESEKEMIKSMLVTGVIL